MSDKQINKHMKNKIYFAAIGIIVLITAVAILLQSLSSVWKAHSCDEIKDINSSIEVMQGKYKNVGFNADTDALKFGRVSPGATVRRTTMVHNTKESTIKISAAGMIAPWLTIAPKTYSLAANQSKEIEFVVTVPENAPLGNYTGHVIFCFK